MDWRRLRYPDDEVAQRTELPTDARRAGPRRGEVDAEQRRARRLRRRVTLFLLGAIFVTGSVAALLADGGYLEARRLQRQRSDLESQVEQQQARVWRLEREVKALESERMALERIAHEELGYSKPGEITFLLPDGEARSGSKRGGDENGAGGGVAPKSR